MDSKTSSKLTIDDETLRTQLKIEWEDHHNLRAQSWNVFQLETILIGGLLIADLKIDNSTIKDVHHIIPVVIGSFIFLFTLLCFRLNLYHWGVQQGIFNRIEKLEQLLTIDKVISSDHKGYKTRKNIFQILFTSDIGATRMLHIQLLIMIFALGYLVVRIFFIKNL